MDADRQTGRVNHGFQTAEDGHHAVDERHPDTSAVDWAALEKTGRATMDLRVESLWISVSVAGDFGSTLARKQ